MNRKCRFVLEKEALFAYFQLMKNAAYELPEWQRQVHLQKTVYHTLNKFTHDLSGNFHIAECWVPEDQIQKVVQALQKGCVS